MRDFVNFCNENNLINIDEDGTITWKEEAIKGKCSDKIDGARDQRKDLSDDYKDYCHKMGTVFPFKVVAKGKNKTTAPVAK